MHVQKAQILHCPLLDRACIQDECMWWTSYVRNKSADEQEVVFNCAMGFLPVLLTQGIIEQIQTQNTVQHQTNQMFATFRAMQQKLPIPRMSGNADVDKRTLRVLDEGGDG